MTDLMDHHKKCDFNPRNEDEDKNCKDCDTLSIRREGGFDPHVCLPSVAEVMQKQEKAKEDVFQVKGDINHLKKSIGNIENDINLMIEKIESMEEKAKRREKTDILVSPETKSCPSFWSLALRHALILFFLNVYYFSITSRSDDGLVHSIVVAATAYVGYQFAAQITSMMGFIWTSLGAGPQCLVSKVSPKALEYPSFPVTQTHSDIVQKLCRKGMITSDKVLEVMKAIDGKNYADDNKHYALLNYVAKVLDRMEPYIKEGTKVLQLLGSKSYVFPCLAQMVGSKGSVVGFTSSSKTFAKLEEYHGFFLASKRLTLVLEKRKEKRKEGCPLFAPFDVIIALKSFSHSTVYSLSEQLSPGGVIVDEDGDVLMRNTRNVQRRFKF